VIPKQAPEPRYEWRGVMLDVARHFLPLADVKRFVDVVARYELNRLHLHLSDDQGWRIEIRSWPRLAEVGYPVIADTLRELSNAFGVLQEDGAAHRGTFIIDPNGVLVHMSITEHDVGRSVDEVLRVLRAFRTGALCPANWAAGDATLTIEDDWLGKVFPDLVGPELGALAERAERMSFAPGDTIVAEGDLADRFYVIARGEVAISRRSPEGDEIKLARLGRGQFFGEVGILAETRRTATVRAIGDVELLGLSWQIFQETLERSDRADRDFAEIAKERIAYTP